MHPSESNLALYAGGELGLWARYRMGRHLDECEQCQRQVEQFRGIREWVGSERDELPPGLNWNRLAGELRANIRLGLAAGQIVGPVHEPVGFRWRAAAVALPALVLVLTGWFLQSWNPPLRSRDLAQQTRPQGLILAATANGVELQQGDSTLALLHPGAQPDNVSRLAAGGGVRTRWVDSKTGYVTISHVYAE